MPSAQTSKGELWLDTRGTYGTNASGLGLQQPTTPNGASSNRRPGGRPSGESLGPLPRRQRATTPELRSPYRRNERVGFLNALICAAWIRSGTDDRVYFSLRKSMTIKAYIHTASKRAEVESLLDLGATENFISEDLAYQMRTLITRLHKPRPLFNIDGTKNRKGDITRYTDLNVQTGSKNRMMRFFLMDLGSQQLILGYPWFAAMQPQIDWARGWLEYAHLPVVLRTNSRPTNNLSIRAADSRQTIASKLAEQAIKLKPEVLLPAEYRQFAKVFSEKASEQFLPSRPYDHAIDLKPDAPATLPAKAIRLPTDKLVAAKKFIDENRKLERIEESNGPYASRLFFIKKKDRQLRPVQDYRKLNDHTIKNRYPLPLIPDLIAAVQKAALFTKFDVRWGYNNVRIKPGDEWKAAFITPFGLYQPRVMFFGLTNSPATFQAMMNHIFQQEIREGWLVVYMDDLLIATKDNLTFHKQCVQHILQKLLDHDLYLKLSKCKFHK
jgi:hypothetical protein